MADSEAADPARILSQRAIDAGYLAARADIGRFNLGLFGITGVGKSTLLNAVFGANVARTGIGDPVTQESTLYRSDLGSLGIFDTKGLELGSDMADILRDFLDFIDQNRLGSIDDQIHVIWYCIRAGDRRIQPAEESFIRRVASIGIPVLLVMTQTPLTPTGDIPTRRSWRRQSGSSAFPSAVTSTSSTPGRTTSRRCLRTDWTSCWRPPPKSFRRVCATHWPQPNRWTDGSSGHGRRA